MTTHAPGLPPLFLLRMTEPSWLLHLSIHTGLPVPLPLPFPPFPNKRDPSSPAYRYEFERLQIEFRRSQENLRIEREANAAQRALYEREIEEAEHRHQAELASVRRRYGTDDSSSKRRRE